jgi:hypothetical protein
LAFLLALTPVPVRAETLVASSFSSGKDRMSLVGLNEDHAAQSPDGANVSGETWLLSGGGAVDVMMWDDAARVRNGGAVAVSLGGRNANAILTVSVDVTFDVPDAEGIANSSSEAELLKMQGDFKSGRAILGFYSEVPPQKYGHRYKAFTGLQVHTDGSLQLYVAGVPSGAPIPFGGTFHPEEGIVLTYSVNTATGALTEVSFGSSSAAYRFPTNAFTKEATAFAGFGGTLGNGPLYVSFRNFSVTAAPASPER